MKYSKDRDIDRIVREKLKEGWVVKQGGKHKKLIAPNGAMTLINFNAGCPHTLQNWKHQLKRIEHDQTQSVQPADR